MWMYRISLRVVDWSEEIRGGDILKGGDWLAWIAGCGLFRFLWTKYGASFQSLFIFFWTISPLSFSPMPIPSCKHIRKHGTPYASSSPYLFYFFFQQKCWRVATLYIYCSLLTVERLNCWPYRSTQPNQKTSNMKITKNIARIHQAPTGRWHITNDALPYLDERSHGYKSRREAVAISRYQGWTHQVNRGGKLAKL